MRPIDADKFEVIGGYVPEDYDSDSYLAGCKEILEMIDNAPTIDVVSIGVYEQIKWERDVAIAQLEELGIGFGQKKPDMVEVVRCKDCNCFIEYSLKSDSKVEKTNGDCIIRRIFSDGDDRFSAVQYNDYCSMGRRKHE